SVSLRVSARDGRNRCDSYRPNLAGGVPRTTTNTAAPPRDTGSIRLVLESAQAARELQVDLAAVEQARVLRRKLRLISRSDRCDRRPTNDALARLDLL